MDSDTTEGIVAFGEYKGHRLIVLGKESKFPFQFGAGKAKHIITAMEALGPANFLTVLKNFVEGEDKE